MVHIHPIVISYSGCATTAFRESLMTLGVSHAAAAKALTRVAKIALDYNSEILITEEDTDYHGNGGELRLELTACLTAGYLIDLAAFGAPSATPPESVISNF